MKRLTLLSYYNRFDCNRIFSHSLSYLASSQKLKTYWANYYLNQGYKQSLAIKQ